MPDAWTQQELADVANLVMGQSPPGSSYNTEGEGLPFIQGAAEFGSRYPQPEKWCSDPRRVAMPGDLLFSVRAPVGTLNFAETELAVGRGLAVIRGRSPAWTEFLALALEHERAQVRAASGTGMFESITKAGLSSIRLPCPSDEMVGQVVELFAALEATGTTLTATLAAATDARKALMHSLFGAHQDEPQMSLDDAVEMTSGSTPKSGDPRFWENGTVPYLKSGELRDGQVDKPTCYVTEDAVKDARLKLYRPGTVLLAMYGATRGRVGRLTIEAAGNQAIAAMVPRDSAVLDADFLFFWLLHEQARMIGAGFGGAQQNLSQAFLKATEIPVPSLADQQRVALVLDAASDVVRNCATASSDLKRLRGALLAAVFTGKVEAPPLAARVQATA